MKKDLSVLPLLSAVRFCGENTKRFGYHRSGKRRYRCLDCHRTFIRNSSANHHMVQLSFILPIYSWPLQQICMWRNWLLFLTDNIWPVLHFFWIIRYMPADILEYFTPTTAMNTDPWAYGCDGKWLGRVGVFSSTATSPPRKSLVVVNRMSPSIGI